MIVTRHDAKASDRAFSFSGGGGGAIESHSWLPWRHDTDSSWSHNTLIVIIFTVTCSQSVSRTPEDNTDVGLSLACRRLFYTSHFSFDKATRTVRLCMLGLLYDNNNGALVLALAVSLPATCLCHVYIASLCLGMDACKCRHGTKQSQRRF